MTALTILGVLFAFTLGAPAVANAYCCWNKAICIAVCGAPCCGSNLTTGENEKLGKISVRNLQSEIDACNDASAMQGVLKEEIERRKEAGKPGRAR